MTQTNIIKAVCFQDTMVLKGSAVINFHNANFSLERYDNPTDTAAITAQCVIAIAKKCSWLSYGFDNNSNIKSAWDSGTRFIYILQTRDITKFKWFLPVLGKSSKYVSVDRPCWSIRRCHPHVRFRITRIWRSLPACRWWFIGRADGFLDWCISPWTNRK